MSPWRRAEFAALLATIPAFYLSLLSKSGAIALCLYSIGAGVSGLVILVELPTRTSHASRRQALVRHQIGLLLVAGLLLSAALPSGGELGVLVIRLATALLVVLRVGESWRPWFWHSEIPKFLALVILVLVTCGAGFWWLEPQAHTFGDGFWLAFTTAATVGYGDIVPSTPASKIFAVFVVLTGLAVISLVTAAIAATWVQAEERKIEKEVLQDLHRQLQSIQADVRAISCLLRTDTLSSRVVFAPADTTKDHLP